MIPNAKAAKDSRSPGRYAVGCPGQFLLGHESVFEDEDEAIAACGDGPPGCEVHDRVADRWIGPTCQEDVDAAKDRLAARRGVGPRAARPESPSVGRTE